MNESQLEFVSKFESQLNKAMREDNEIWIRQAYNNMIDLFNLFIHLPDCEFKTWLQARVFQLSGLVESYKVTA